MAGTGGEMLGYVSVGDYFVFIVANFIDNALNTRPTFVRSA